MFVPRLLYRRPAPTPLLLGVLFFAAPALDAALIQPTSLTVTPLVGGASPSEPWTDDVVMTEIVFPGATYTAGLGAFRVVDWARVNSFRNSVNAEFGDDDDGADGNPNPFVTAGVINEGDPLPDATRETTDPTIQDAAIRAAFNSLSLTQGIDGENSDYVLDLVFQNGILDNSFGMDQAPELVFFERGVNSDFSVQLILGGTLANPILSAPVTILRSDLWDSDVTINTIEIGGGQDLGVVGVDLDEFGVANGAVAYGVRIQSLNNSGADLYGNFLAAQNQTQFVPLPPGLEPDAVPEPSTVLLFGAGLLGLVGLRRRKR